jgi:hypothetical protein
MLTSEHHLWAESSEKDGTIQEKGGWDVSFIAQFISYSFP